MAKHAAESLLILCALIASACSPEIPDEGLSATTSSSSAETTTAAQETSSTTQAPSTTETTTADPTTTAVASSEFEAFDIPPGFFLESLVTGEKLVLYGSSAKGVGGVFWAVDQPFESAANLWDIAPADIDPGSINQMVYFEGSYYGFPIWAEPEDPLSPTMYVSDDGVEWRKTKFESITKQASLRRTPDQPSSIGGAGVSTLTVSGGQIVATGWVTENGQPVAVVWTGDGTNWTQTNLPTVEGVTQGGSIAASSLGQIVTVEGGSYYGFGTFYRTPESGWSLIEPSVDEDGTERFTRQLGASDNNFYRLEYSHEFVPMLTRSSDGSNWEEVELPDVEFETLWIHVAADDRLTVYDRQWLEGDDSMPTVWSQNDVGWTSVSYEGTRILLANDEQVVTATDDQIRVYKIDS